MASGKSDRKVKGFQFSPWNLLLIIPLLVLITPLFNSDSPRILGMPFFYWFQFLCVPIGVLCTWIVYMMTRDKPTTERPDRLSVDELDEGDVK